MGLFGKKKLSLEEIIEGIKTLSEEEKAQAIEAMQSKDDAEPTESVEVEEKETDGENMEGEQVEEKETVEEVEETDVAEVDNTEEGVESAETEEPVADETLSEEESATDEMANDNRDEIIHQLTDKVNELSEQIKGLLELKTLMEEYTKKQADNFGYKGNLLGAKKDIRDMSADELKGHLVRGI